MNGLNKEGDGFWLRSLLVLVLVVATCARFYALDLQSLNFYGLNQIASCETDNWLALMNHFVGFSGLPPLYPTLLCSFIHLLGDSDFVIRMLSSLAGLASVYLLYITGRDLYSPTAGLLAATLLAANYQILLFDREVSVNSLLMLCYLAHGYCFCRLFFPRSQQGAAPRPLLVQFTGHHSLLQWRWQPRFPADGPLLVGFWISGVLAFYTSSMSLLLFLTEFLVTVFLFTRTAAFRGTFSVGTLLRTLWLPLVLAMLPWLPILQRYVNAIRQGYILGWQSPLQAWQKAQLLFPLDTLFVYAAFVLLAGFILFIVIMKYFRRQPLPNAAMLAYTGFSWLIALLSLLCIKGDYSSYAYLSWLTVLMLLLPVAFLLDKIPQETTRLAVLGLLVVASLVIQLYSNYHHDLYARTKGSDFRLAAQIIQDDEDFKARHGLIIKSSNLFDHYLRRQQLLSVDDSPDHIASMLQPGEFYYLELTASSGEETETFKKLSAQYQMVCLTKLPARIRLVKFSAAAPASTTTTDCRIYLNHVVSL